MNLLHDPPRGFRNRWMGPLFAVHGAIDSTLAAANMRLRHLVLSDCIPKKIHQVLLGDVSQPSRWSTWMNDWTRLNPGFEYRLWRDESCEDFIRRHDPEFVEVWNSIPERLWVIKADYIRVLITAVEGGYYFDCDVEPVAPISRLSLAGIECVLFLENSVQICNAGFGAIPGHPLMMKALKNIRDNIRGDVRQRDQIGIYDVLRLTGPIQLDETAKDAGADIELASLLTSADFRQGRHRDFVANGILVCPESALSRRSRRNFFAVHWYYNSWLDACR